MKTLMKKRTHIDSIEAYAGCICAAATCTCGCSCGCWCTPYNPLVSDRDNAQTTAHNNYSYSVNLHNETVAHTM